MGRVQFNKKREYENNINVLREKKQLTISELADLCQTTPSTMQLASQAMVSIYDKDHKVKCWANQLCQVFDTDLGNIFPFEVCTWEDPEKPNLTRTQLDEIIGCSNSYSSEKITESMSMILSVLSSEEKFVITELFLKETPIEYICEDLEIERTKIRLIEAKALRKLRTKINARMFKPIRQDIELFHTDPYWWNIFNPTKDVKNEVVQAIEKARKEEEIRLEERRNEKIQEKIRLEKEKIERRKQRKKETIERRKRISIERTIEHTNMLARINEEHIKQEKENLERLERIKTFKKRLEIADVWQWSWPREKLNIDEMKLHNSALFKSAKELQLKINERVICSSKSIYNYVSPFLAMYIVTGSSFGYIERVTNLYEFCETYNVNIEHVYHCVLGQYAQTNGWIFEKIEE